MRAVTSLLIFLLFATVGCAAAVSSRSVVAQPPPATSFALPAGGELRLEDTRGEVVVLAFFTTYCPTSPAVLRAIDDLRARNKAGGLKVIAVYEGDPANTTQMRDFAARLGVRVTVVLDRDGAAAKQFALVTVPSIVVIDQSGTVRHVHAGYRGEDDRSAIDREVSALLVQETHGGPVVD